LGGGAEVLGGGAEVLGGGAEVLGGGAGWSEVGWVVVGLPEVKEMGQGRVVVVVVRGGR
jgi:hypothetical protein